MTFLTTMIDKNYRKSSKDKVFMHDVSIPIFIAAMRDVFMHDSSIL